MDRRILGLAGVVAAAAMAAPSDAEACGGAFYPAGTEKVVVTGHRMAFSISKTQTVLWDEMHYTGDPQEFAFVVPARPGARLELSSDAWFEALDAATQPIVDGPQVECGGGGCGLGCGSGGATTSQLGGVQVQSSVVQGPYAVDTVHATNGESIAAWLVDRGFVVPAGTTPILDAYASEGFDFIVVRLRPGASVDAMQPVRLVTPGADPTLPFRMMAAGAGDRIDITLYVVSEGRYRVQGFPEASVDASKLVWDGAANRSNYDDLVTAAVTGPSGPAWLTEEAGLIAGSPSYGRYDAQTLYDSACKPSPAVCAGGAGDDASAQDAGCAAAAVCDDFEVATRGATISDVWVTRLRASLPPAVLAAGDLHLEAAPVQAPVSGRYSATRFSDPSYDPCTAPPHAATDAATGARGHLGRRLGDGVTLLFTALGLAMMVRRRR